MLNKLSLLALLVLSSAASAMSLDWTGTYRTEFDQVDRPSLSTTADRKAYLLNYLALDPHIVASDGVEISGRIDVLGNQDPTYANTQMGQVLGQGLTPPNPPGSVAGGNNNVLYNNKPYTNIRVSELYLNANQEYGSLIVGRAPYEFGMGLVYSAGRGPFDHWATIMDMVAYKFIVGNISVMPIIGRDAVNAIGQPNNSIDDMMIEFLYTAKESNSVLGGNIGQRAAPFPMNDTPYGAGLVGGPNAAVNDKFSMKTTDIYFTKTWDTFRFRFEAAFVTGNFGVLDASSTNVTANTYGMATEMDFLRPDSKWDWSLRFGLASGDDPTTTTVWEGFAFNRNYDVAQLLFNYHLGQADFLRTGIIRDPTHSNASSLDDEAISNAYYISPKFRYGWNEHFDLTTTWTYAMLMTNPTNASGLRKDLGLEVDMGANYLPRKNIRWENSLALLFPGQAFNDGGGFDNNGATLPGGRLDNGFTTGVYSRAAISF